MNMPIGSSRHKLLLSLILIPQLVYGGPQGWVSGQRQVDRQGYRQGYRQEWIAAAPPIPIRATYLRLTSCLLPIIEICLFDHLQATPQSAMFAL